MKRSLVAVPAVVVVAAVAIAAGCGGSKSTNPAGVGPVFDLRFPDQNSSQTFVFNDGGSWDYHCITHQAQGMEGVVVVDANSGADSALVTIGAGNALTFTPATVVIKPGGKVRWINASTMSNHTVTRP